MKAILTSLMILSISQVVFSKEYSFQIPKTDIVFKAEASDIYKAREIASEKCFDKFVSSQNKITRSYGMAAIDVCVNLKAN